MKVDMGNEPVAQSFRDLLVWQKSVQLATATYQLTREFPAEESYGLTSQIRRAAVSISSNIAEGRGRLAVGEFRHFLGMARGSSYEVQSHLEIACTLSLGKAEAMDKAQALCTEVTKMINGLLKALDRRQATNH